MLTLLSFLGFTALVAVISWVKTRRDDLGHETGYFLAGRSLGWIVIAGSLFLTNISAEQLTGLNANAFSSGANVMAWETVAALTLIALAFVFLPRYLRSGIRTVPQFLEYRYGRRMRLISSFIFIYAIVIGFLPFVLYAGAITLGQLFDIGALLGIGQQATTWVMVIAIGVVGGIYAVFGGLKAVAVSDTVNGIGLMIAGLLVPVLGLQALGGGDFLAGWELMVTNAPERLQAVTASSSGAADIPWEGMISGILLINLFYWCTNQAIVQRALGARSLAESQKGVLAAGFLKMAGILMLVLPGIIAWHLNQQGMLEIPTTPGSDALNADIAYPVLVHAILPPWLTGFFCAAMFGAVLSSFNSGVNSLSTLISLDIYKSLIKPAASDRETVVVGRAFGIVTIVVCIAIAPFIANADSLFTLMKTIMAVINVPIFTVVLFGVLSKRAPALAGYAGMVFGMVFFYTGHFVLGDDLGVFQPHWLLLVGINFLLMLGVMSLVRYWKPLPAPVELPDTREVDTTPWRFAAHASWALVALFLVVYAALSPLGVTSADGAWWQVIGAAALTLAVCYGLYRTIGALLRRSSATASS